MMLFRKATLALGLMLQLLTSAERTTTAAEMTKAKADAAPEMTEIKAKDEEERLQAAYDAYRECFGA